jgi:hypothetical protein
VPALSPGTPVRIRVGASQWGLKLRWVEDLLSKAERAAFYESAQLGKPYRVAERAGRAAFTMLLPAAHQP